MIFPFESLSHANRETGLVVAVLIGFCFGFVLERAGFGRSTKLADQFYFRDMTVFKVMFSAIVTAMLGVVIAGSLGLVDLLHVSQLVASNTFLWPMLVGGLLLGVGFIVSGYCPGTSLVSAASGNYDGMLTFAGVIAGSILFGVAYPWIANFYISSDQGQLFIYEMLGIPPAVVAMAVAAAAVGCFIGAEIVEKYVAQRFFNFPPPVEKRVASRRFAFVTFGVTGMAGLVLLFVPVGTHATETSSVEKVSESITVEILARRILDEPWKLRILDIRPEKEFLEQRIPGSENVAVGDIDDLGLKYSAGVKDLVLVGKGKLSKAPAPALAFPGHVFRLEGGFEAWRRFALTEPASPQSNAPEEVIAAYRFQSAVHSAITGAAAPPPPKKTTKFKAPPKRKGGGCS